MPASAYLTAVEFRVLAPAKACAGVTDAAIETHIAGASALADDYLSSRYPLPLATWGGDLKRAVCAIALYDLLSQRGFGASGDSTLYKQRHDESIAWLAKVQAGEASLTRNATEASPSPRARVSTAAGRGFRQTDDTGE